ncbi:hypothetical protein GOP47_0005525 [Adiantum capillus-veneris]|nr:hypothetical protein GOP47_0005525 [Adiantum capillus-veneris]
MARRGLLAALLGRSQAEGYSEVPFKLLTRSFSNKLFVGGLSFRTDEDAVRRAFSQHGEVVEVKLISDRETGRPKGFGFVTFESEADAETARSKMTGQLLDGRVIRVDKATSSRPPLPSSGFSTGSNSASVGGSFSSPMSSSLPPVAEDWGAIPSNIVDLGAGASPTTAAPPSNGFGVDISKPFDSSSFGQAAASWPASTPAPPSSTTTSSWGPIPGNIVDLGAGASPTAAALPSNGFGLDTSKPFDSNSFGQAAASWPASTPAPVSSTTTLSSTICTTASANSSWVNTSIPSSEAIPAATIIESNTTTVSSNTGTVTNSASSGAAYSSKPLESTAVAGVPPTTLTTPAPSAPSAHPLSSPALTSSGSFDFSNFSFNSSSYRDNDPPLPRRRPRPRPRPATQTMSSDFNSSTASLLETRSPFGSNNQFAETSIPKPKGTEMDFGLLNIIAPSPPGMRPQGVFDVYLPDDLPEIPPPEPKPKPKPMSLSMFPHRQLPDLDLPYHTPEADNWSEIGKDPPKYDLSTLFPSMGELIKKDKEFHWDPFDFDPDFKLPPEEKVIIIDSDYDDPM